MNVVLMHGPSLVPPSSVPTWWSLALVTVCAFGVAWLLRRVVRARALSLARRWTHVVLVATWASVALLWQRRLVPNESAHGLVGLTVLVVVSLAALPWLRNLFHALVFSFEDRYRIGDDLRVGEVKGRLVAVGPRTVVLRAGDGTEVTIPHMTVASASVVKLNLDIRDAPSELVLTAPSEVDVDTAVELARVAAALSPYAAPRMEPRAFVIADRAVGGVRLRLRGFVFDREHESLYRSDVGTRFMRLVRERARARGDRVS